MGNVTLRQLAVLRVIEHHRRTKGYPPTIREIGDALGISSTNGVSDHLRALQRKKLLIERSEIEARAHVVTGAGLNLLNPRDWPLDAVGLFDAFVHQNVNPSSPRKAFVVLRGITELGEGSTAGEAIQRAAQLWGAQR